MTGAPSLFYSTVRSLGYRLSKRAEVYDDDPAHGDLIAFTQRLYPGYQAARIHRVIADALEQVSAGKIDRLILTMPPRHGKSELASVNFPAWHLGRHPDERVIACSHTGALANRFSRQVRNKISDPRFPFPVRLAPGAAQVQEWNLDAQRGGYRAAGVGGGITGMGADILLIDDPVKSAEEAMSANAREAAWEWYTGTAYTRLEKGGRIVVIGTRWHHDDLIGRLLKEQTNGGDQWVVIDLVALVENEEEAATDPLGRSVGDALWPEKYDTEALLRIKRTVGSYNWSAQYKSRPTTDEGNIFKREHWVRWATQPAWTAGPYLVLDTAFSEKETADWSVMGTFYENAVGWDLTDVWRGQVGYPTLREVVLTKAAAINPVAVVIENKASGQSLIQELKKNTRLPIIPFEPGSRDKLVRAHAISPLVEGKRIGLPRHASWVDTFIDELAEFPLGSHDDQVDVLSMFLLYATMRGEFEDLDEETVEALQDLGL